MRQLALRAVRKVLRRLDALLQGPGDSPASSRQSADPLVAGRYREALLSLELDGASKEYLETHIDRLVRTLTLTPPPGSKGSILELGCYMQITPLLSSELGYSEVLGAYVGEAGTYHERSARARNGVEFRCRIDLFDAERDSFPYADGRFETVLACEILEHLARDPLHLLLECRRVLADGGALLLTTPNAIGLTGVARALRGRENPQVFSRYPDPRKKETGGPHVREYSPEEVGVVLRAAGFRVEWMLTERGDGFADDTWALDLLSENQFDVSMRGEQIYCLARKDGAAVTERYPKTIYC